MPGKRITNPSLVVTNYPEAISNEAKLLLDWDGLVWARPVPLKLIGNSWMQGSYDAVSWDNYILNDHNYLRVSTDGGVTWRIIDLTGDALDHPPVTIGSPDGGLVISGNDTQVLTLSPATTTTPGSLSASDKVKIDDIKWYDVANVGAGSGLYKDSTLLGDDVTFNFKTLVAGTGVTLTPDTDTITIDATGAGGGEVNTGSNQGTLGYGVFDGKVGVDLQFRHVALDLAETALQLALDDVNNNITWSLDQTLIDHDVLTNFVVNEHIDHSAVSILTTEGIAGGGDLTTTRTLTLAFDGLSQQTSVNDTDVFAFYRPGDDLHYNIEYSDMKVWIKNHTDIYYVPLTTSINAGLGLSGGGTLDQDRTLYLDINGLPTVPYSASDYVAVYDTSALTHGKVTLSDIVGELAVNITAGAGMDFTTITSTGSIILGTPTTLTKTTSNSASGTTHEHIVDLSTWNLQDLGNIDIPTDQYFMYYDLVSNTFKFADPAIGASAPGLPLNSIQFNDNNTFGGNSGLLYNPTIDTIYFNDTNVGSGISMIFGTSTVSAPSITTGVVGTAGYLKLENDNTFQNYIQLLGGRVLLGNPTLTGDTFLHIKDSNLSSYNNVLKIDDLLDTELLRLDTAGKLFIPELSSASTSNILYFNTTTGEITYGAPSAGAGGVQTLITDSLSGLAVNGGSTSSASTIELDQNDNKLVVATPVLSDYIGFYDVSAGKQSKTLISNLPGIQLQLNGVYQEDLKLGNVFNLNQGSNVTITYDSVTNSYTVAAAVSSTLPEGGTDGQILTISEGATTWADPCAVIEDCTTAIDPNTGNVNLTITRVNCEEMTQLYSTSFTSITTNLTKIKIVTVPTIGELQYNGITVLTNDELTVTLGALQYDLFYVTDSGTGSAYNDSFTFQLLYSSNSGYLSTANVQVGVNACVTDAVCFGYLYNWYAVDDSREITSSADWSVPTETNITDLITHLGGQSVAGGKLKSTGLVYWDDPNTSATDDFGFDMRGSGLRTSAGAYTDLKSFGYAWTSSQYNASNSWYYNTTRTSATLFYNIKNFKEGLSVRLVKSATGLADGTTTTYTGNDGKVYNAVAINELYWTTENLEETQYRNGDYIPNVEDNTTWSGLTTGALCLYNNDLNSACKLPLPS